MKFPLTNEMILENVSAIDLGEFPIYAGKLTKNCSVRFPSATLSRRLTEDGVRWAIEDSGVSCLNKEGEFEYQPMHSERTDEFFERCRFDTKEEAYDYYQRWKEWVVEKFHRGVIWGTNTWDDEKFHF